MSDPEQRSGWRAPGPRRRWSVKLGNLPELIVAAISVICATVVWPSELSWWLVGIAILALIIAGRFEFEFGDPE